MEESIIRVKSYLGSDVISCGSGVFISPNHVLTAAHVINAGDSCVVVINGKEKVALVEKENDVAALLALEDQVEHNNIQIFFTTEELLTEDAEWRIEGYITDEQEYHQIYGEGLVYTEESVLGTDFKLQNIKSGYAENYKGMSGSPVICNGRIVGILQVQSLNNKGLLGLDMTSTNCIIELLPRSVICTSKYLEEFENYTSDFTKAALNKNVLNKKYIPDIFVEEGEYKENFRYFSEPALFLKKVLDELLAFDLREINRYLTIRKEKEVDFSDVKSFASSHTILETCDWLIVRLEDAVTSIQKASDKFFDGKTSTEKRYMNEDWGKYMLKYTFSDIIHEICFFKYQTILITNEAGQGKTNFLCDYTSNFLLTKNIPALFYNAYDFHEPIINYIKKDMTINNAYSWEYVCNALTQKWNRDNRATIIIVDGLNENTALNDFCGYVEDFLKEIQKLPFIKVVLSTRNELFDERFENLNSNKLGNGFYLMNMKQKSNNFKDRIFWGYLNFFEIDIMESALSNYTYETLSNDTLLLRFFCEVYQGKKQLRLMDIHRYSLFKKYYEMKRQDSISKGSYSEEAIFDKLIDHICHLMLESKQFSQVSRNDLSIEELTIFDKLLESDVVFKQDVHIKRGLLEEQETVIGFTFDEFRDYCLTRFVLKKDTFWDLWREMHEEKWSILEGVERYVFFLARTESLEILPILKDEKEYDQLYWKNVWALEEVNITAEDILLWKDEVLSNGHHTASVVYFLVNRRDRGSCKINIDLLFDILNLLANNLTIYNSVIQEMFNEERSVSYDIIERESVVNTLIKTFSAHKNDIEFIRKERDILRLSIYMVEIDSYRITSMWKDIYLSAQEVVENILSIYLSEDNLPPLVYCNVNVIVTYLLNAFKGSEMLMKIKLDLDKKLNKDKYKTINDILNSIWNT